VSAHASAADVYFVVRAELSALTLPGQKRSLGISTHPPNPPWTPVQTVIAMMAVTMAAVAVMTCSDHQP